MAGRGWRGDTVIPGRAKREPGIHNHDGDYGFPDVQLHI